MGKNVRLVPNRAPDAVSIPDPLTAAISLAGVDLTFPSDAGPVKALSSIDLRVEKQEFVSIVGRSGCGKSTLLRVIAGLLTPSVGKISVMGTSAAEARLCRSGKLRSKAPPLAGLSLFRGGRVLTSPLRCSLWSSEE